MGNKEYTGTPELRELIVARYPDDIIFTNGDYDNYAEIMHPTNALRRNIDESETKPKANKSWKWKHILKPILDENDLYTGSCLTSSVSTIILPSDPVALVERLDVLMAIKAAGNTGVRKNWYQFAMNC